MCALHCETLCNLFYTHLLLSLSSKIRFSQFKIKTQTHPKRYITNSIQVFKKSCKFEFINEN